MFTNLSRQSLGVGAKNYFWTPVLDLQSNLYVSIFPWPVLVWNDGRKTEIMMIWWMAQ